MLDKIDETISFYLCVSLSETLTDYTLTNGIINRNCNVTESDAHKDRGKWTLPFYTTCHHSRDHNTLIELQF